MTEGLKSQQITGKSSQY